VAQAQAVVIGLSKHVAGPSPLTWQSIASGPGHRRGSGPFGLCAVRTASTPPSPLAGCAAVKGRVVAVHEQLSRSDH
jgi:hypothetical protein